MALIVAIVNQSRDLPDLSEYKYEVLIGDGGPLSRVIASGTVQHRRSLGWQTLVQKVLAQHPLPEGESPL